MLGAVVALATVPVPDRTITLPVADGSASWPSQPTPNGIYTLDGTWLLQRDSTDGFLPVRVPSVAWSVGTGRYRLHLSLPEGAAERYELFLTNAATGYAVFVNGSEVGGSAGVGVVHRPIRASAQPFVLPIELRVGDNLIEIVVVNEIHPRGGLWEPVHLAVAPLLTRHHERYVAIDLVMFGSLVFLGFLHLAFWSFRPDMKEFLLFGIGAITVAVGNIARGSFAIYSLLPNIGYLTVKRAQFILYYVAAALLAGVFGRRVQRRSQRVLIAVFIGLSATLSVATVVLPFRVAYAIAPVFYPAAVLAFAIYIFQRVGDVGSARSTTDTRPAVAEIASALILIYGIAHDSIGIYTGTYGLQLMPAAVYLFTVFHTFSLGRMFADTLRRTTEAQAAIIRVADRERRNLARDIHDGVGQLTHGLEFLAEGAIRSGVHDRDGLIKMRDTAHSIAREVRDVVDQLHPVRVDGPNLADAVNRVADRVETTYSLPVVREIESAWCDSTWTTQHEKGRQVLSIVSESLANAVRHATPSQITIQLLSDGGELLMRIVNDGAPTNQIPRTGRRREKSKSHERESRGHGLDIMEYRAHALGGTFWAGLRTDGIFVVDVRLPPGGNR